MTLEQELTTLLNKYSQENASNTPDFILAQFLMNCLSAWNMGVRDRETWFGRPRPPGNPFITYEKIERANEELTEVMEKPVDLPQYD